MSRAYYHTIIVAIILLIGISCRNPTKNTSTNTQEINRAPRTVVGKYHGNLTSTEYDSIVNHLTLYANESFDLQQVDRIAEHHLNERNHEGIYAYLADSTQIGLYSTDGYLMLQFLLTDDGMTQLHLESNKVIDSSIIWKRQE